MYVSKLNIINSVGVFWFDLSYIIVWKPSEVKKITKSYISQVTLTQSFYTVQSKIIETRTGKVDDAATV